MLATIITGLVFSVMLLTLASFIVGVLWARRRHKRLLAFQASSTDSPHPLDPHVTSIIHLHDGVIVGVEKPPPPFTLPSSWYTRLRILVSLGLLLMLLLTLFVQSGLGAGVLQGFTKSFSFLSFAAPPQQVQPITLNTPAHPLPDTASVRLVRIDSGLQSQYYAYQWPSWIYSSCSGIAMEMVMNAYGRHYLAGDILQEEQQLGVWSISMGLLQDNGIAMTAAHFGFNTQDSHSLTVDQLVTIANTGTPVIVSVRDSYYFPNGHLFVIRSGDSQYLYIADSSPANFQRMTRSMFSGMWQGFSAVLTPQ